MSQFSLFAPLHPAFPTPSGNPYTIVHVHGSWEFLHYSISYTVLYSPWLFCNYLFVSLNPLTSSPIPLHPQAKPTPLSMTMGHAYVFFGYSISYTVLYIPMAILELPICTSQSPHLFTHTPTPLSHLATIKTLSVSVILCLFLFP